MVDRTQLNVRLDADTVDRLQLISRIEGETVSDIVREAVRAAISRYAADPGFQERRQKYLETIQGAWE